MCVVTGLGMTRQVERSLFTGCIYTYYDTHANGVCVCACVCVYRRLYFFGVVRVYVVSLFCMYILVNGGRLHTLLEQTGVSCVICAYVYM